MFGILVSAFNAVLAYLLRGAVLKFVLFTTLFLAVKELFSVVADRLPQSGDIAGLFNLLPDGMWFFLYYFKADIGIPLVFSAMFTRFIIRRLPVIG